MNQEKEQEGPSLDAITNNAYAMTTGLNEYIRDSRLSLINMNEELERFKNENAELKEKIKKKKK